MMRYKSKWMVMGGAAAALALVLSPVARAATIFDVNFDGANETLGEAPDTQAASASPVVNALPTGKQNNVTIQTGTSQPNFAGFGSGNFAYFSDATGSYDRLYFQPHSSDLGNKGTITFTFDYRRGSDADQSGGFNIIFYRTGNVEIGRLYISNTAGNFNIGAKDAHDDVTTEGLENLAADTNYTIQTVITMNGHGGGAFDVYAAKDGDALQMLANGQSDAIDMGSDNFYRVMMYASKDTVLAVGVDNITMTYVVPEPASVGLLFLGGVGALGVRRRRK